MSSSLHAPKSVGLEPTSKVWRSVRLGDIAEFIMGQAPPGDASNFEGRGTVFVKAGEFGPTHPVVREWTTKPLRFSKSGDVLICVVGATAGKLNLAIDSAIGRSVAAIRPNSETFDKYLYYQILPKVNALRSASTGSAQGVINRKMLGDIDISLPPLDEQRAIVAEIEKQFTRLEAGVEALKRVQASLKRYRAAVLKAVCEGKLVPTEADWKETVLGKVLIGIEAGRSFKCEERPPKCGEVGVVKVSAVTWGTYDEMESKTCLDKSRFEEKYLIRSDEFLFSRANTIELIGACVIAKKVALQVMLSDKILRFRFSGEANPSWILYWLRSGFGRSEIERLATGNQNSMRNIGQDRIRQIVIKLPPLSEQKRIVEEVERRLSVIEGLEATVSTNLQRATRLRQSILKKSLN